MYYNNRKLIINILEIVMGLALIVLSVLNIIPEDYWSSFGFALALVGAGQAFRNIKYKKNKEYKEKIDITFNDERNRYLRMKAWSWTGFLTVMILCVLCIASMILKKHEYMQIFSYIVCMIILLYWVFYFVFSKKD